MKVLVVAISVFVLISASISCGQGDTQAAERGTLDRVVPTLPNGLSIDEVEERIGEPQAQFSTDDGETVLVYPLWHLVFESSLFKRRRFYPAGYRLADRPVAPLDRKVRALKLGISRQTVERKLGKTETWEIFTLGTNERIWYGNGRWRLHFSDRRLSGKVLYR